MKGLMCRRIAARTLSSLITALLVVCLVPLPAYGDSLIKQDLNSLKCDDITNQVIEIVTVSYDEQGEVPIETGQVTSTVSYSRSRALQRIRDYLNSNAYKQLPFLSSAQERSAGTYIKKTFGAHPTIVLHDGDKVLEQGVDFDVEYENNENVTVGSSPATAHLKGKGAYSGTKDVQFKIVGYRIIERIPESYEGLVRSGDYYYDWGKSNDWRYLDLRPTGTQNRSESIIGYPLVWNGEQFTLLDFTAGKTGDKEIYCYEGSIAVPTVHPGITASSNPEKYRELVDGDSEKIEFAVPVDSTKVVCNKADGVEKTEAWNGVEDWEISNFHYLVDPVSKSADSAGNITWNLADFFELDVVSDHGSVVTGFPTSNDNTRNRFLYRGQANTEAAIVPFLNGLRSKTRIAMNPLSEFGLSDQDALALVSAVRSSEAPKPTLDKSMMKLDGPGYILEDKGYLNQIRELIKLGFLEDGDIDDSPIELRTGMAANIAPYSLSNGVSNDLLSALSVDALKQFLDPGSVTDGSTIPHGSHLTINDEDNSEGNIPSVRLIDGKANLAEITRLTITGFDLDTISCYDVISDSFGRTTKSTGNTLVSYLTDPSGKTSSTKLNLSNTLPTLTSPGQYSLYIAGTATTTLLYNRPYGGQTDTLKFNVVEVSDDVSLSSLQAKLDSAKRAIEANSQVAIVSVSNSGLPSQNELDELRGGDKYLLQTDVDAMLNALATAEKTYWDASTTQEQIDSQTEALTAAIQAYENALMGPREVETSELAQAIKDTEEAIADDTVKVSDDGRTYGENNMELAIGDKYILFTDKVNLETAIAEAKEMLEEAANPSQKEVNDKATILQTNRASFIKLMGAASYADFENLDHTYKAALDTQKKIESFAKPENNSDLNSLPKDTPYVLKADSDALDEAIKNAKEWLNKIPEEGKLSDSITTKQLDEAKNALIATAEKCNVEKRVTVDLSVLNTAISTATEAKAGVTSSENGSGLNVGSKWVTSSVMSTFETALNAAKAVQAKEKPSQNEIASAAETLNGATATFMAAIETVQPISLTSKVSFVGVSDKTATALNQQFTVTPEVTYDGNKKLTAGTDYTASLTDNGGRTFPATLSNGSYSFTISGSTSSSPTSENKIVYTLTITGTGNYTDSASTTFTLTLPNKMAQLEEVIDEAQSLIDSFAGYSVIEAAKDSAAYQQAYDGMAKGTKFLLKSDADSMESALSAAKDVCKNESATETQIAQQVTQLQNAMNAYRAAVNTVTVDTSKLAQAVNDVRTALNKADLKVSPDGETDTSGNKLAIGDRYILTANKASLESAMANADALMAADATPTQKAINDAATSLQTDRVAFIKLMGAASYDDFSGLQDAYETGTQKSSELSGVQKPTSAEAVKNLENGVQYVMKENCDQLDTALGSAKTLLDQKPEQGKVSDSITTTQVQNAKDALDSAVSACAVQTVNVSKTALDNALSNAANAKTGVEISSNGSGLEEGTKWVTQSAMDALNSKISAAEDVKSNTKASQSTVTSSTSALNDAIETFKNAIKEASATQPVSLLSNVAYTGVSNLEATDSSQTFTVAPTVKLKDGTKLTAETDYTATLKDNGGKSFEGTVTDGGRYSFTISGDTSSEPASNNQIIYTFTVTGTGAYKDTDSTTFTLTLPKVQEVMKGLSLASSADEQNRVRVTAFIDGETATITRATSSNVKIAQANLQNNGASALVAGLTPGVATITVTAKDAEGTEYTQTMMYVSTSYAGGQTVETKKVTNNAQGVELDGLPAALNDDLRVEVVKGDATGKSSMVNAGGQEKSLGLFDVVLKYQGTEVQPLGKINVTFAVDGVDSVGDNMKVVAYHWHGDTTTPKVYDAAFSRAGSQSFVTVPVAELSVFEPAYVKRTTATDENPGDTGTEKPPASGDDDNNNKNDGTGDGDDQNNNNSGDGDGNGGATPDKDLAGGSIIGLKTSYDYTGSTIPIEFSMVLGSKTLTANTDYTYALTYSNGTSSTYNEVNVVKDAGMYRLTLTGKGDYTGTKSASFAVKSSGSGTGTGTGTNGSGSTGTTGTTGTAGLNGTNSGTGSTSTPGATTAGTGTGTTSKTGTSLVQTGDALAMAMLLVLVGAAIAVGAIRQARGYERRKKR